MQGAVLETTVTNTAIINYNLGKFFAERHSNAGAGELRLMPRTSQFEIVTDVGICVQEFLLLCSRGGSNTVAFLNVYLD